MECLILTMLQKNINENGGMTRLQLLILVIIAIIIVALSFSTMAGISKSGRGGYRCRNRCRCHQEVLQAHRWVSNKFRCLGDGSWR